MLLAKYSNTTVYFIALIVALPTALFNFRASVPPCLNQGLLHQPLLLVNGGRKMEVGHMISPYLDLRLFITVANIFFFYKLILCI